jgi:hypothetical protein
VAITNDGAAAPTYLVSLHFFIGWGVRRISVTHIRFHNVYARTETRSIKRKMSRAASLVSLDVVIAKDFWLTCVAPRR